MIALARFRNLEADVEARSLEKAVLCRAECPSGWPDGDAVGCDMNYAHPSQIMDEIAGFSFARLDELGSIQWPCTAAAPEGTPIMHLDGFARSRGKFVRTDMSRPRREQRPAFRCCRECRSSGPQGLELWGILVAAASNKPLKTARLVDETGPCWR